MLTVGVGSYGLACVAHLGLIVLLSIRRVSRHWTIAGLAAIMTLWAASGLGIALGIEAADPIYRFLDFLRAAALILLLSSAFRHLSTRTGDRLAPIAAGVALVLGAFAASGDPNAAFAASVGHVGLAVAGLFLVEKLLKASRPAALWSTKHLLIGTGTILAFDLFYYTDALLLLRIDDTLRAAQPAIATLALPLILIGARRLSEVKIHLPLSRGLLVGTTALLASGIYILSVAAIAYLIRGLGWAWGPTLQLIFLFGAAMVLVVLLSSTSLRHGGRRFIERNIFTFAYDYRREWLRLVEGMAGVPDTGGEGELSLDRRALKAAATLMDADGAALFMRSAEGGFRYKTSWNLALKRSGAKAPPACLLDRLSPGRPALVLPEPDDEGAAEAGLLGRPEVEDWLEGFRDPWIALALIARNETVGLAVITRPRMRRSLSFEDLDLLAIFGHQLGSYLMVDELARHVAETEHFERMSKHVTFVAHDLKNVISQLSLVLQQAKDHAHDPAFVSDTFLTIGDAVERMKALMHKVQQGAGRERLEPLDLSVLVQTMQAGDRVDALAACTGGIMVEAEPAAFRSLLDHLVDNAREACEAAAACEVGATCDSAKVASGPRVALALRQDGAFAVLEIVDQGVGMSADFIENELFSAFKSTKAQGFGIGMYQCREWIERWRGRLEVESEPGRGTTVRITLPLAETRPDHGTDAPAIETRTPEGQAA